MNSADRYTKKSRVQEADEAAKAATAKANNDFFILFIPINERFLLCLQDDKCLQ